MSQRRGDAWQAESYTRRAILQLGAVCGLSASAGVGTAAVNQQSRGGQLEWDANIGARSQSSPTVVDGTVYIGGVDIVSDHSEDVSIVGTLRAFDATAGEKRWQFETGTQVYGAPTVVDDHVFVGSIETIEEDGEIETTTGSVYALDANTGETRWSVEADGGIWSSPTVANGTVYVGCADRHVYALRADDGTELWRFQTGGPVTAPPTVVDSTVYIPSTDGYLYALDGTEGVGEWSVEIGETGRAGVTVSEETVYVSARKSESAQDESEYQSHTKALSRNDGSERWTLETTYGPLSTPTVAGELLLIAGQNTFSTDESPTVFALDRNSGDEIWEFPQGRAHGCAPTVVDETVFVGTSDFSGVGTVFALEKSSGEIQWEFTASVSEGAPTVADGTVYFPGYDGTLSAIDAGVDGSSSDTRVYQGIHGHHGGWKHGDQTIELGASSENDATGAGLGVGAGMGGIATAGYLLYRRVSGRENGE